MKRLNAKQILVLPIGKYPDGDGLYLSIYKPGRGKWSLRYTLNKKAREMGLGSFPEVTLLDARQHALSNKQLLIKKIDPIDEKNRAEVLRQQQSKKFSDIANLYIETKKKPNMKTTKRFLNGFGLLLKKTGILNKNINSLLKVMSIKVCGANLFLF